MSENDPLRAVLRELRAVLREWKAPEPSPALDVRVRAGFRAMRTPSPWARFWAARVSVPVPVLAAVMLMTLVVWLVEFRPAPPAPPLARGVVTRLEATGFQPVTDGVAIVEEVQR